MVVVLLLAFAPFQSMAQDADRGAVVFILDASGSMNRVDDGGTVLIDGAKNALTRLVGGFPAGSPVGLMVYGHRVPNDDKANGCRDTEMVVPVGPLDADAMVDAISSVAARGFTPIGRALEEAAAALPDGHGTIILVSDGEDTCAPPDPCEVAASVVERGIDVRVHTVGFFLADEEVARSQLQCIADATEGSYHEVDAVGDLAGEIGVLVQQALPESDQPFEVPLDGGTSTNAAPLLPLRLSSLGAGQLDGRVNGVIRPGETRWYAIDVEDGPLALAAIASVGPLVSGSLPGDVVRLLVVDGDGRQYQTGSSRFGRQEIELSTVRTAEGETLGTTASFSGFDVPWSDDGGMYLMPILGLDREGYEATVAEMLLRPAPPPLIDGRYYIGIEWDAAPSAREERITLGTTLWPHSEVKHLVYTSVDGGTSAELATALVPPPSDANWMAPLDDDVTRRGGFTGAIASGETRSYVVYPTQGSSITVRAFLNRPLPAAAEGEFAVDLYDGDGMSVGQPRSGYPTALGLAEIGQLHTEDDFMHPHGIAPRPLVGAVAEDTDGPVLLSFTWDGPAGEHGEVEFVVDVMGDLTEPPAVSETSAELETPEGVDPSGTADESATAAEQIAAESDTESDSVIDGAPVAILVVLALISAAALATAAVFRRRRVRP